MPVLTQRRETQIVAFLLLFFVAHAAMSQDCRQNEQVDVRYSCDLLNMTKNSNVNWNNWTTGTGSCADISGPDKLFVHQTATILRAEDFTLLGDAGSVNEETLPLFLSQNAQVGDLITGLQVERKSSTKAGLVGINAEYNITVKVFIGKAAADVDPNAPALRMVEMKSKAMRSTADNNQRSIDVDYIDPVSQTAFNLHCAAKIRD